MLPNTLAEFQIIEQESMADKTYKLGDSHIAGMTEDIAQAVYKILNTERYRYPIYSWDYGFESEDLYGMDAEYVMSELPLRIKDALMTDERILEVKKFTMKRNGANISCKFTVKTKNGEFDAEKEVNI